MAASPCTPSTNFDGLTPGNTVQTSIVFYNSLNQPTGVTASIAYASNGQGGDRRPGGTGPSRRPLPYPSWNYIEIEMLSELTAGDWVTLTLSLNQAVSGLSFIDPRHRQSAKRSEPGRVGATSSRSAAPSRAARWRTSPHSETTSTGTGTAANPFQSDRLGRQPDRQRPEPRHGHLQRAGERQFVIKYRAGQNGYSGNQHIGLGNISYNICQPATAPSKQARSLSAPLATEPRLLPQETDGFVGADGAA